jgi:Tfp pilus assembly protein PilF
MRPLNHRENPPSSITVQKEPHEPPSRMAGIPSTAVQHVESGTRALQAQQAAPAEQSLRAALALAPEHPEILRLLAIALRLQNRNTEALDLLRRAAGQQPDDALIQNGLGTALDALGDGDAAIAAFRRACELAPQSAQLWSNLGKTLSDRGCLEEALPVLERAARMSNHPATELLLAYAQRALGYIDESAQRFRGMIANNPADGTAWLGLADLKTRRLSNADIVAIERAMQHPELQEGEHISLGFALAKALDDHGRYPEAFAAYVQANAETRQMHPWQAAHFTALVDAVLNAFAKAPASTPGTQGDEVIFIVSLPRSGSSLTEQILASHPKIEGAGELEDLTAIIKAESERRRQPFPLWVAAATSQDWLRLGQDYLACTARWRRPGMRFTDKLPGNWLRAGVIMAMLPGARIIDCRRDPVEACFSCFRTLFNHGNQEFSYDLADLAKYWNDYDRSMRHWQTLYPERIRVQSYEALVADPERETRELLRFCGVEFDPACLRFHESRRSVRTASASQVREPIQSDTARADKYGALLDPLRAALGMPPFSVK